MLLYFFTFNLSFLNTKHLLLYLFTDNLSFLQLDDIYCNTNKQIKKRTMNKLIFAIKLLITFLVTLTCNMFISKNFDTNIFELFTFSLIISLSVYNFITNKFFLFTDIKTLFGHWHLSPLQWRGFYFAYMLPIIYFFG